jgi:hypothetical protein
MTHKQHSNAANYHEATLLMQQEESLWAHVISSSYMTLWLHDTPTTCAMYGDRCAVHCLTPPLTRHSSGKQRWHTAQNGWQYSKLLWEKVVFTWKAGCVHKVDPLSLICPQTKIQTTNHILEKPCSTCPCHQHSSPKPQGHLSVHTSASPSPSSPASLSLLCWAYTCLSN